MAADSSPNTLSTLGLITARGGSKGVPGKNIKLLAGKPLIVWTIEVALASGRLDRLILSTDSHEIADIASKAGCEVPFMRPDELATDAATSVDVISHALETISSDHDIVVLLQPTSPMRAPEDIVNCLDVLSAEDAPFAVSVVDTTLPPEHIYRVDARGRLVPVIESGNATRRQELNPSYALNGAVYAFKRDWFIDTGCLNIADAIPYKMPSARSIDIDTELDFFIAGALMQHKQLMS